MKNHKEDKPILDSGERTEFETGAVRDMKHGKGRMDLIPIDLLMTLVARGNRKSAVRVLLHIAYFLKEYGCIHLFDAVDEFIKITDYSELEMLIELSKHFEKGAEKYEPWNWTKGIPTHSYLDSALRHFVKWSYGMDDEPHDIAFVWNIYCMIWTIWHKPELNDIHFYGIDYTVLSD